jgi:chromatin segregation and condensation protein Rec8/ScpA/Scc1 (kleisin family)
VLVETYATAKNGTGTGEQRWNPQNRETADHSIPYVVAATLMEIKSRTLLPPDPTAQEEDEDDAGIELVRRLIEYKEFREAAEHLGERVRAQSEKFPRPRLRPTDEASEEPEPESLLEELVVWDLMEAFAQVVAQTRLAPSTRVIRSDVPLSVYMDEVLRTVRLSRGPVDFLDFFRDESTRPRIVGIFLSLLELYRRKLVLVTELDGGLVISLRDPEEPIPQSDDAEAVTNNEQQATNNAAVPDNRQPTTDNAFAAEHEHEQEHEDDAGQGVGGRERP